MRLQRGRRMSLRSSASASPIEATGRHWHCTSRTGRGHMVCALSQLQKTVNGCANQLSRDIQFSTMQQLCFKTAGKKLFAMTATGAVKTGLLMGSMTALQVGPRPLKTGETRHPFARKARRGIESRSYDSMASEVALWLGQLAEPAINKAAA